MKFVKCSWENNQHEFWWGYDETTPKNCATIFTSNGKKKYGVNIIDCEIADYKSWDDLDYHGTVINDDKYQTGWVAPNGTFYGCDYNFHEKQALLVFKKSERELEKAGFIKITKDYDYRQKGLLVLCFEVAPTHKQIKWFKDNYTSVNREDVLNVLMLCKELYSKNKTSEKEL